MKHQLIRTTRPGMNQTRANHKVPYIDGILINQCRSALNNKALARKSNLTSDI